MCAPTMRSTSSRAALRVDLRVITIPAPTTVLPELPPAKRFLAPEHRACPWTALGKR